MVQLKEAVEYADENKLVFLETSSKSGKNVTEIFLALARHMHSSDFKNVHSGINLPEQEADQGESIAKANKSWRMKC